MTCSDTIEVENNFSCVVNTDNVVALSDCACQVFGHEQEESRSNIFGMSEVDQGTSVSSILFV